jgi:hypothetical protein
MKSKIIILVAGFLAAVGFTAPKQAVAQDELTKELATIETALWKAWKEGDAAPFQEHLAATTMQIGEWGMSDDRAMIIANASAGVCDVGEYEFEDWKVHRVSEDVAILTYEAEQDASCEGEALAKEILVSSTYVREGGAWKVASYQETAAGSDD